MLVRVHLSNNARMFQNQQASRPMLQLAAMQPNWLDNFCQAAKAAQQQKKRQQRCQRIQPRTGQITLSFVRNKTETATSLTAKVVN